MNLNVTRNSRLAEEGPNAESREEETGSCGTNSLFQKKWVKNLQGVEANRKSRMEKLQSPEQPGESRN